MAHKSRIRLRKSIVLFIANSEMTRNYVTSAKRVAGGTSTSTHIRDVTWTRFCCKIAENSSGSDTNALPYDVLW